MPHSSTSGPVTLVVNGSILTHKSEKMDARRMDHTTTMVGVLFWRPMRPLRKGYRWGCLKQTGVSLRYMMEFGSKPTDKNLLISAQFLHKELAIRIARRAIELENLPYGLSQKPAVLKVHFLHCSAELWVIFNHQIV